MTTLIANMLKHLFKTALSGTIQADPSDAFSHNTNFMRQTQVLPAKLGNWVKNGPIWPPGVEILRDA